MLQKSRERADAAGGSGVGIASSISDETIQASIEPVAGSDRTSQAAQPSSSSRLDDHLEALNNEPNSEDDGEMEEFISDANKFPSL